MGKHFGSSRHFAHQPYTFHIIWTLFGSSGFRTLSKSPRWSRHLSCHSDRLYGYFADHLDTFHIIQTLLGLFGHFADHPETLQTIHRFSISSDWLLLRPSGSVMGDIPDTQRARKKKLSRYAKKIAYTLMRILWLCPAPMTISWLRPSEPTWPWSLHECRDAALSRCTGAIEHCFIHPGSCWWISPSSHLKNIVKKIPTQIQNTKIQKYSKSPRLGQGGWSDPGIREWG